MPLRRASLFIIKNMKKIIQSVKTNLLDTVIIIIVSVMYLLNNRYIKIATSGILHEFFVCYFNDLMAPMFMLAYSNILLDTVNRKFSKLIHIVMFCLVVGIVWEFVAPLVKKYADFDSIDILCYLVGGIIYWKVQNRKVIIRNDKC